MKKIASFNVNGLRSAVQKGFNEWLKNCGYDIICIQETKMDISYEDIDMFYSQGYKAYWHCAKKKGYSGVLILSKEEPKNIEIGCGISQYDDEGRIIRAEFKDFSVLNIYIPSGTTGEDRHAFKMKFLEEIYPWFKNLIYQHKKLIVAGDYNIVHKDLDIHNPERKDNPSGYRPEERAWLDAWFTELFDDSFRIIKPKEKEFSWWSYRAGSYAKDKGWRIDYQSISKPYGKLVKDFQHLRDIRFSDHCPIVATYDI
ncbi:MAG: exodeoxyribonuclease III [Saprospiraceae bacterium]|nr:exodeoxyribonuclease III [Saprospiraceae bacterium]